MHFVSNLTRGDKTANLKKRKKKKKLPMLLLGWDTENKKQRQKWRWIPVEPLLLTKHCLQCVLVSGSAMAWSSGQLTLKLWALGCKGPDGEAGQLLSSAVISCRVYALELTNGLARRLLDAPLKQTLWSSADVCEHKNDHRTLCDKI